jgi:hypothetical protein
LSHDPLYSLISVLLAHHCVPFCLVRHLDMYVHIWSIGQVGVLEHTCSRPECLVFAFQVLALVILYSVRIERLLERMLERTIDRSTERWCTVPCSGTVTCRYGPYILAVLIWSARHTQVSVSHTCACLCSHSYRLHI